jgi:hypothetical protein
MVMAQDASEACDVICRATVSATADMVRRHLLALAKATLSLRGEFSVIFHLTADASATLPAGLAMYNHGTINDDAYAAAAARARIVVDLDDGAPSDMRRRRLAALKQLGPHVLAEDSPIAREDLPTDTIFNTPEELVNRVYARLEQVKGRWAPQV